MSEQNRKKPGSRPRKSYSSGDDKATERSSVKREGSRSGFGSSEGKREYKARPFVTKSRSSERRSSGEGRDERRSSFDKPGRGKSDDKRKSFGAGTRSKSEAPDERKDYSSKYASDRNSRSGKKPFSRGEKNFRPKGADSGHDENEGSFERRAKIFDGKKRDYSRTSSTEGPEKKEYKPRSTSSFKSREKSERPERGEKRERPEKREGLFSSEKKERFGEKKSFRKDDREKSTFRTERKPKGQEENDVEETFDRPERRERPARREVSSFDNRRERSGDRKKFSKDEGTEFKPRFKKDSRNNGDEETIESFKRPGRTSIERKPKSSNTTKGSRENQDGLIRLNKFIANSGICSRREADQLIETGVISVNGKIITELGYKISPTDIINYGGETVKREKTVYILINKPKDYITTSDDPMDRKTVLHLIKGACPERVYPVGRLDRASTGVLLLTNDGELTKKLTHPRYEKKKIYHVVLDKPLKMSDMQRITDGVELEDGFVKVDEINYVTGAASKKEVGIELHSGKNRIIRRIFESLDYKVIKLDRVYFAGLTKKDLPRGRWRFLSEKEVSMLKMGNLT